MPDILEGRSRFILHLVVLREVMYFKAVSEHLLPASSFVSQILRSRFGT